MAAVECRSLDQISDGEVTATLSRLAADMRRSEAEMLVYLNEMRQRQLYALAGYPSLFAYCIKELKFSEGTTCRRLIALKVVARFPVALELVVGGQLHVAALAMLDKHLTEDNHADIFQRAAGCSKMQLEWLVAGLAPRPDVPGSIRKMSSTAAAGDLAHASQQDQASPLQSDVRGGEEGAVVTGPVVGADGPVSPPPLRAGKSISVVQPLSQQRVMIKCSADAEVADKIARARELLAHKFPRGELEHVLDAALEALLDRLAPERKLARQKRRAERAAARTNPAAAPRGGSNAPPPPVSEPISEEQPAPVPEHIPTRSRYIAADAKSKAWEEAGGRCTYIGSDGRRCAERRALEWDHVQPFALGGYGSADNVRCYCRTHNAFAARESFGVFGGAKGAVV